jgi:phosphoketolase
MKLLAGNNSETAESARSMMERQLSQMARLLDDLLDVSRITRGELAIQNEIDRFSLAIDVINRVPRLKSTGAHAKEKFRNEQIECRNYAYEYGVDKPEQANWKWPY